MKQNDLKPQLGSRKKCKRVGRGIGSGHGTYSTRGMKGQKCRSGGTIRPGFEGGQTPLVRKMPKLKGFKNINRIFYQVVNLVTLNKNFTDGQEVTPEILYKNNLISKKNYAIKILGDGELNKKLIITAHKFSKSALEKIKKAGGEIKEIGNSKL